MKTLTVLELSKLYNINRQTIYNNIKKGILSKNSDNKIDFSEIENPFDSLAYEPANPVILEIYKDLQGAMHCNFLEQSSN